MLFALEAVMSELSQNEASELRVPMAVVVDFIRQLSHDLRNNLNAAELQSAFLKEIAVDAEVKSEMQRLREILACMGGNLQALTRSLAQINLTTMPYPAANLMADLRSKIRAQFPEQSAGISWEVDVAEATLQVDGQLLQEALLELFANAFQHERAKAHLKVKAEVSGDQFLFNLREPKTTSPGSTESWGREPFRNLRHGHYSLGLLRARTIIEAHRGQFSACYDSPSSFLTTTVVLPVSSRNEEASCLDGSSS